MHPALKPRNKEKTMHFALQLRFTMCVNLAIELQLILLNLTLLFTVAKISRIRQLKGLT